MPNPNSLILNILLWNIIKMTHPIAFVNYWIFEKLRLIIETFKYQLLLATKSFHLHSLRTSSTFTPFTWARCTSTTRVSYNTYRSRLRRRWTASRGTRSPRVPAPVAVNATALRVARHVPSALSTVRRRTSASTATGVRSNGPLLEHHPTSACPWTASRCWPII